MFVLSSSIDTLRVNPQVKDFPSFGIASSYIFTNPDDQPPIILLALSAASVSMFSVGVKRGATQKAIGS